MQYAKRRTTGLTYLHIHTIYRYDGTASVAGVLDRAREVGLAVIAITDHDEIKGSLKAFDLAPHFGIEVIHRNDYESRGSGWDLYCPHPMARGMGMKSLSRASIHQAMQHPEASRILLGIETYNATALDRVSNAQALAAEHPELTRVGNSDAHILQTIGLGATEFLGYTAANLLDALWIGATEIRRGAQLGSARILGSWAINYVFSAPARAAVLDL